MVRIVGSRALGIFPNTVGSSTRIGVRPVVIGAPTVRLAEIVGTGCVAIAAAAAAAITMRLRERLPLRVGRLQLFRPDIVVNETVPEAC